MKVEDRRAEILNEAIWLVSEQGFGGLTVNLLARRCGLTTAGLLHHFGSKDELVIALLKERDRRDREALRKTMDFTPGRDPSREEVLKALGAIIARNVGQPHLVKLNVMARAEALVRDHPARDFFDKREAEVRTLFTRMVSAYVVDPDAAALQLMCMMQGLEFQWLLENGRFDLAAEWTKAADKLLAEFARPPGAADSRELDGV